MEKYNLKFFYNNYGKNIKIDEVYSNVGSKYDKEWYKKDRNIYYTETYSSEKYFENAKELIQQKFIFSEITEEKNLELINKIKNRESVSIHVRRGDYIGNNVVGNMVKLDYYNEAIKYIENKVKNPIYIIFSNDIEWCKENLNLINKEVVYVEWNKKEKSFRDMQLMSLCKHNICTNSGFSWWGAWLNKNLEKIVIIPEKWYSSESKISSDDIAPQNWIKIKNY